MDRLMPEARRTSDAASTIIDLARVPRLLPQVSSDGSCGGGSASMLVGIVVALRRSGINPTVFCNFASLLPLATVIPIPIWSGRGSTGGTFVSMPAQSKR